MFEFWEEELDEEQTEALIEKAAAEIRRRKMTVPAVMALEMHKPLAGIASSAGVVFAPFLVPFFGFDNVNDYTRVFSKRENFERLMARLEMPEAPDEGEARPDTGDASEE
jgi:hypothetical protein